MQGEIEILQASVADKYMCIYGRYIIKIYIYVCIHVYIYNQDITMIYIWKMDIYGKWNHGFLPSMLPLKKSKRQNAYFSLIPFQEGLFSASKLGNVFWGVQKQSAYIYIYNLYIYTYYIYILFIYIHIHIRTYTVYNIYIWAVTGNDAVFQVGIKTGIRLTSARSTIAV